MLKLNKKLIQDSAELAIIGRLQDLWLIIRRWSIQDAKFLWTPKIYFTGKNLKIDRSV